MPNNLRGQVICIFMFSIIIEMWPLASLILLIVHNSIFVSFVDVQSTQFLLVLLMFKVLMKPVINLLS